MWTGNFSTILKVRYSKDGVCYTTSHILVECFLTSQSHTFSQLKEESQKRPTVMTWQVFAGSSPAQKWNLYSQGSIDGMHFRPRRTGIHFFRLREIRSAAKIRGFSTTLRIIGPSKVASFWGPYPCVIQVHSPFHWRVLPVLREKNKTLPTRSIFHQGHDAKNCHSWTPPWDSWSI